MRPANWFVNSKSPEIKIMIPPARVATVYNFVAIRVWALPLSIPLRKATAAIPKATFVIVMPMQMTSAPNSDNATIEFSRQKSTISATAGQGTIPVIAATPMISRQRAIGGSITFCAVPVTQADPAAEPSAVSIRAAHSQPLRYLITSRIPSTTSNTPVSIISA